MELLSELIRRTVDVGMNNHYIADVKFKYALSRAKECDQEREEAKKAGKEVGLLHGIPISLKDQIFVKGCASNMCQSHNLYPPVEEDATLVTILKRAGAIPFVKTTTPVSGTIETNSYLWGMAKNPLDPSISPGGSSGGEAGFVASRASILGLAVDLGGSVRAPAAMCGVPGFFPT